MKTYQVRMTVYYVTEIEAESYDEAIEQASYLDPEDMEAVDNDPVEVDEIDEEE